MTKQAKRNEAGQEFQAINAAKIEALEAGNLELAAELTAQLEEINAKLWSLA